MSVHIGSPSKGDEHLTDEDLAALTPPAEDAVGVGGIIVLALLSPLLLVLFILLGLIWLFLLPFRSCMHHHSAGYQEQPPALTEVLPGGGEQGAFFQAKSTGAWLFYRVWKPIGVQPKGIVFSAHGFGEHISRVGYTLLAEKLNAKGLVLAALDHQGHGRSTGDRAFFESIDHLVADYLQFTRMPIAGVGAELPRFIFGHSMGGLIALSAAVQSITPEYQSAHSPNEARFDGIVLSSPCLAIDPKLATPPLKIAAQVLSNIFPKLILKGLPPSFLSRNAAAVTAYEQDPLIHHGGARARVGAEMLREMKRLRGQLTTLRTPILLVHGTQDKVVPPFASTYVYDGVSSQDKTFLKYSGLFHEIFEDEDAEKWFDDITEWMVKHMTQHKRKVSTSESAVHVVNFHVDQE